MALTRVDCRFYRGSKTTVESSSFVALNPTRKPGSLLLAGACAARDNLSGQVACRLAMEHFIDGVLEFFDSRESQREPQNGEVHTSQNEISLDVLEAAFKRANNSVYHFGHKLAAGGRMATSLLGLVIEQCVIAAGRAGDGCAYLRRGGQLFPFFESGIAADENLGKYLGAHALVSVELASVPVEESDMILLFSGKLSAKEEARLIDHAALLNDWQGDSLEKFLIQVFSDVEKLPWSIAARIGPEAIYLKEVAGGRTAQRYD